MILFGTASLVKGVRVPRKRGDGEGSLKQKTIAGRKVWWARWVEWGQMEPSAGRKGSWAPFATSHRSAKRVKN